jgi:hypothetical protein
MHSVKEYYKQLNAGSDEQKQGGGSDNFLSVV